MKVRIPLLRAFDGEHAFVIIDTDKIEAISRVAAKVCRDGKTDTVETTTSIRMTSGRDIDIEDEDLREGWTHDTLLHALDVTVGTRAQSWAGWNPPEHPGTPAKKPKK